MFLYEPINVLKPFADGIWIVDGPIVRMSVPGGSIPFPSRMTVVRLSSGDLLLHSPTEVNEALQEQLEALGRIRHLVSPNCIHYAHIGKWKERYPEAIAWASPGVRKRAASQKIDVRFDDDLKDAPEEAWAAELDQLLFRGSRLIEEVVFFHRATRTLVLTDLIENFERERLGRFGALVARLGGVLAPNGATPVDFRLTFFGRKAAARASFERMQQWKPERIVIAHGRCFEKDAEGELSRAFRWVQTAPV